MTPENGVYSLGYLMILLTTEGLKIAQIALNLEKKKHTGRNQPTMSIRLGFLIKNFFVQLSSQVFYRDSHTNPYIFVGDQ